MRKDLNSDNYWCRNHIGLRQKAKVVALQFSRVEMHSLHRTVGAYGLFGPTAKL